MGYPVIGIGESAALKRETAAADAFDEPELEALELGDAPFGRSFARNGLTVAVARVVARRVGAMADATCGS